MTIVHDVESKGPGTHALIIGVGDYPLFEPGGELTGLRSAYQSALLLASWLRQDFANPEAPLASLDLLASAPTGSVSLGDPGELERPTFKAVQSAVAAWRKRCDSHEGNIALFSFTGHGAESAETLLYLDDFRGPGQPPGNAAPTVASIASAMVNCKARRQVYFIDVTRTPAREGVLAATLLDSAGRDEPPVRTIFYSTLPGRPAFGRIDAPSFFSRALIDSLNNTPADSSTGAIATGALIDPINTRLARSLAEVGLSDQRIQADITGSFDLHYPRLGSRPSKTDPPAAAAVEGSAQPAQPASQQSVQKHASGSGARDEFPLTTDGAAVEANAAEVIAAKAIAAETVGAQTKQAWTELPTASQDALGRGGPDEDRSSASPAGDELPPIERRPPLDLQGRPGSGDPWRFQKSLPPGDDHDDDDDPSDGHAPEGEGATEASAGPGSGGVAEAGGMPTLGEDPLDGGFVAPVAVDESATEFVSDDAETERDELGRSVLAIGLARRLHRIWRTANEKVAPPVSDDERAAFVVHLDAPWGGGKTTFANYLARVLDPAPAGHEPAAFLRERYGEADLGGIFLDDPPADPAAAEKLAGLPAGARRPWIVVPFNAWQVEHCAPPWWVFYQTIRKGCFDSVLKEGDLPWSPQTGRPALPLPQRLDMWAKLWLREYWWRLTNPKVRSLLVTAAISLVLLLLLQRFGIWGLIGGKEPKTGFILTGGLGLVLGGLTGVTFLWGLGALFTESIVPGTDTLAERLSLGSGDPFERFRRHFARTIARVRRPVMVVVDDLDRCRPDFVVGLVRGIQTLHRSPRVVFVILGDRDWIERAFEAHHKAMEKVDVGPEQTFGARFVEKAIQMSFILPAMGDEGRLAYVRRVLLGATPSPEREAGAMDAGTAKAVREVVNREATAPDADPFDTQRIVTKALEEVGARPDASVADEAALQLQVEQLVGETLAINATSSERVEQAVAHQLEALAAHFPPNPRQIKRIVNAITIYYAVALQRPGLDPDEAFRTQLALWIIIMTEWPETWRLLASFPALVPILQSEDPLASLEAEGADLPGSIEATATVVKRILADAELMALIKGRGSVPLDPARIPLLAQLTPLHSRKRRLPEEKASAKDAEKGEAAR